MSGSNSLAAAGRTAVAPLTEQEKKAYLDVRTDSITARKDRVATDGWSASGGEQAESKHAMQTLLVNDPGAYMDQRAAALAPLKQTVNAAHASALNDLLLASVPVHEAEKQAAAVAAGVRKLGGILINAKYPVANDTKVLGVIR